MWNAQEHSHLHTFTGHRDSVSVSVFLCDIITSLLLVSISVCVFGVGSGLSEGKSRTVQLLI